MSKGMADLSMGELDSTINYEFKENNEKQQSMDDIDAFERRLEGGGAPPPTKAPVVRSVPKPSGRPPMPVVGKGKTGAEYVAASKAAKEGRTSQKPKPAKSSRSGDDEDEADDFDDTRQAMSDLNKFDRNHGASDDDDY